MSDRRTIKVVKKVMPAVVSILAAKHLADLEKDPSELYSLLPGHPVKKEGGFRIPRELVDSRGMVNVGGGSGFLVDPQGLVLTNKHVLGDPRTEYTVILEGDERYPAEILSRDPLNDVAILRIPAKGLPVVPLGDASRVELGETVLAIGNALGVFNNTVSLGIVSGLSRSISAKGGPRGKTEELRGLIQTDAAINPGNSGGPLVDLRGRAIGINAAVVSGAQSIGFAIPINTARRDLDDIRRYGEIRRPFLGVRYLMIDKEIQARSGLPVDYGALVVRETPHREAVIPKSPAHAAGIREKDIILSLNGERTTPEKPIQDFLETMAVGDKLKMQVLRGGKEFCAEAVLAERK